MRYFKKYLKILKLTSGIKSIHSYHIYKEAFLAMIEDGFPIREENGQYVIETDEKKYTLNKTELSGTEDKDIQNNPLPVSKEPKQQPEPTTEKNTINEHINTATSEKEKEEETYHQNDIPAEEDDDGDLETFSDETGGFSYVPEPIEPNKGDNIADKTSDEQTPESEDESSNVSSQPRTKKRRRRRRRNKAADMVLEMPFDNTDVDKDIEKAKTAAAAVNTNAEQAQEEEKPFSRTNENTSDTDWKATSKDFKPAMNPEAEETNIKEENKEEIKDAVEIEQEKNKEETVKEENAAENVEIVRDGKVLVEGVDYIGAPPSDAQIQIADERINSIRANIVKERESKKEKNEEPAQTAQAEKTPKPEKVPEPQEKEKQETTPKQDAPPKQDIAQTVKPMNTKYVPEFPSDMKKDEFIFLYDSIVVRSPNGVEEEAELFVSPMSLSDGDRIIVWSNTGKGTNTEVSGAKRNVIVHLELCDVVVSGQMNNGRFTPFVALTDRDVQKGYQLEEDPYLQNGGKGHIMLEDVGIRIHMFPISFENNEEGDAEFFYCIAKGRREENCGDSLDGPVMFRHENMDKRLVGKWKTETQRLYAAVLKW